MATIISGNSPTTIGDDTTINGDITADNITPGGQIVGYQQGVWIPNLTFNYSTGYGFVWWRIGNVVSLQGTLGGFSNLEATTPVAVGGMPYLPSALDNFNAGSCMSKNTSIPCTAIYMLTNELFRFYASGTGMSTGWEALKFNQTSASTLLSWSLSYLTDDTTWTPINGATVS